MGFLWVKDIENRMVLKTFQVIFQIYQFKLISFFDDFTNQNWLNKIEIFEKLIERFCIILTHKNPTGVTPIAFD